MKINLEEEVVTDGSVKVILNDKKIVNWVGNVGRNEGERVPYFKIGIYRGPLKCPTLCINPATRIPNSSSS